MASDSSKSMLILGGSGFLSGTLARMALKQGYHVWAVTRGRNALPVGVMGLIADRRETAAFQKAVLNSGQSWDVVVDCIGYELPDAQQDIAVFRNLARHFVFISTDFVYDPVWRKYPQGEDAEFYVREGYGGKKRQCELEFINAGVDPMPWTILRPCYIYGPGSFLGSLPLHRRDPQLIEKLRNGEPLKLVGGGHFMQHPVYVKDLAATILSLPGNENTYRKIFNVGGPELVEALGYFRIVADILGVPLKVEEIPTSIHLAAHPEDSLSCCNRIYDLTRLRESGASVPATSLVDGLRDQIKSMIAGEV